MKNLFTQLVYLLEKKKDAMIVTIVRSDGSTPRGAGAQMLVSTRGQIGGTIGGGAIEKRSVEMAMEMIPEKRSVLHEFVLQKGAAEDIGMECGGDATVYFQYVDAADARWADLSARILQKLQDAEEGALVLHLDGSFPELTDLPPAADEESLFTAASFAGAESHLSPDGQRFAIPLPVGERAIIFGAGHCALALVPILSSVGFRVTVMDDRAGLLTEDRYPSAKQLVCGEFTDIESRLAIEDGDYAVVMTSGHAHDYEVEEQVLRKNCAYVGVIGSRKKLASVNERLRAAGIAEEKIESVHAPIGLAIQAITPEEIAVSIAAEMIAHRAALRQKTQPDVRYCPV